MNKKIDENIIEKVIHREAVFNMVSLMKVNVRIINIIMVVLLIKVKTIASSKLTFPHTVCSAHYTLLKTNQASMYNAIGVGIRPRP